MESKETVNSLAWQPLTFGGVAAFSRASFSRLWAMEVVAALISAASIICLFYMAWEPSLREAITRLPDVGAIHGGYLEWSNSTVVRLSDSAFLSIAIDPSDTGETGQVGDVQLELRRTHLRFRSLLGHISIPYLPQWKIAMDRVKLEPWWGAWHPVVSAALGMSVGVGLLLVWGLLAAIYAPLARLIAHCAGRRTTLAGSWRLASASLMPGALLANAAIIAYSFGQINLVQLLFAGLLHLAVGWIFVLVSPLRLPRVDGAPGSSKNPFSGSRIGGQSDQ